MIDQIAEFLNIKQGKFYCFTVHFIHKIYFTPTNALLSYKDVLVHKIIIKTS